MGRRRPHCEVEYRDWVVERGKWGVEYRDGEYRDWVVERGEYSGENGGLSISMGSIGLGLLKWGVWKRGLGR